MNNFGHLFFNAEVPFKCHISLVEKKINDGAIGQEKYSRGYQFFHLKVPLAADHFFCHIIVN